MPRTRIKICGVRDAVIARAAADAGADGVGLMFVSRSPRCVTVENSRAVLEALPPFVEPVAVFMDADPATIRTTVEFLGIRTVQLHGAETPDMARELAPLRIIKAFPCDANLAAALNAWREVANLAGCLIDAPALEQGDLPGGGGRTFDWSVLTATFKAGVATDHPPLILAGGLTVENVAGAVRAVHPYAVDVSSGVESSRGVKDPQRIRAFCEAVRNADTP